MYFANFPKMPITQSDIRKSGEQTSQLRKQSKSPDVSIFTPIIRVEIQRGQVLQLAPRFVQAVITRGERSTQDGFRSRLEQLGDCSSPLPFRGLSVGVQRSLQARKVASMTGTVFLTFTLACLSPCLAQMLEDKDDLTGRNGSKLLASCSRRPRALVFPDPSQFLLSN
ncbi:hypothetical protein E2986_12932 [Frieseomelitta varia]|uniref:Uncharacterized protein n=1 Tax=Frieseomelitta varia TaxID=561572 RepID=A0A833WA33_9HYME|nr:hypothetical protein E2986_12932 [Frieseomelitta varia]